MKAKSFLIDTHILLWWLEDSPRLPKQIKAVLKDMDNFIYVSAATILEINIKRSRGKLRVAPDYLAVIKASGFKELLISFDHAEEVGKLEYIHKDPFDRILIAQALVEKLPLLSIDKTIKQYPIKVVS